MDDAIASSQETERLIAGDSKSQEGLQLRSWTRDQKHDGSLSLAPVVSEIFMVQGFEYATGLREVNQPDALKEERSVEVSSVVAWAEAMEQWAKGPTICHGLSEALENCFWDVALSYDASNGCNGVKRHFYGPWTCRYLKWSN